MDANASLIQVMLQEREPGFVASIAEYMGSLSCEELLEEYGNNAPRYIQEFHEDFAYWLGNRYEDE